MPTNVNYWSAFKKHSHTINNAWWFNMCIVIGKCCPMKHCLDINTFWMCRNNFPTFTRFRAEIPPLTIFEMSTSKTSSVPPPPTCFRAYLPPNFEPASHGQYSCHTMLVIVILIPLGNDWPVLTTLDILTRIGLVVSVLQLTAKLTTISVWSAFIEMIY